MKLGKLITIGLFIFIPCFSYAQKKTIQPLSIGDKVPDITFKNVLNYKSNKAKLSDFKGKLVILDMWSTWCTSCITAFPEMETLQKQFKDKIQILLVNPHNPKYDSKQKIESVLARLKQRSGFYPSLPIPINDTILNDVPENKVILEVKNAKKFRKKYDLANAYCYDLTLPPTPSSSFRVATYLRDDLKHSFNISAYKEKRKIETLVISTTDKISST